MRVALVSETYLPQVNGVSRTLRELVRRLEDRGDRVLLIHPDYGEAPTHEPTCRVHSISLPFYRELRLPVPPFSSAYRSVEAFRPEIVHIATEATLGLSMLRFARRRNVPVVSSFHTNFDQYSGHYGVGFARGVIWRYLRWFHNETRETYVPSRTTIADLAQRGFERLVLWPRGVDSDLFRPDRPGRATIRERLGWKPDDVVIAYVGRIAAEKNIEYLADALDRVRQSATQVRFLFVGDGPLRSALEERLGSSAVFAGYRLGDDLADHYAAADVMGFASLTETFGNVVLEGMSSGLPVVALRAGGVAEIVNDGKTGFLLPPEVPASQFADRLLKLVGDSSLRSQMALAAREYALQQSWAEIMDQLRQRYEAVLESSRPAAFTAIS
ncbi:MAG: glycosyltransferase family 1 protein [Isosphaeraceae bacterium]